MRENRAWEVRVLALGEMAETRVAPRAVVANLSHWDEVADRTKRQSATRLAPSRTGLAIG